MEIEIFKRNTSLKRLGITELNKDEDALYHFLEKVISEIVCTKDNLHPDILLLGKENKQPMFEYKLGSTNIYASLTKLMIMSKRLKISYNELSELLIWWISINGKFEINHTQINEITICVLPERKR